MSIPTIIPVPASDIIRNIAPKDWANCIDTWTLVTQIYLTLSTAQFAPLAKTQSSLVSFLMTYLHESARDFTDQNLVELSKATSLRKNVFLLVHRVVIEFGAPGNLLHTDVLGDLCRNYRKTKSLQPLLDHLWHNKNTEIEASLQETKTFLTRAFTASRFLQAEDTFCTQYLIPLFRCSPAAGTFFLAGSDFIDSLSATYPFPPKEAQSRLLLLAYLCLTSPLKVEKPNLSLFIDQLYALRQSQGTKDSKSNASNALLSALVSDTPLLTKIERASTGVDGRRVEILITSLAEFRRPSCQRRKHRQTGLSNGKARASGTDGTVGGTGVHRISLITQVQDLFPDLGSAFVARLLDEYNDNVELVTAHLLEDSLPPHLNTLDRAQVLADESSDTQAHADLAPRLTPPKSLPERRNIFDNDDFDRLAIDASRLHRGKATSSNTADIILSDKSQAPNKAAILAALATFDSDDDERDDTYDLEDVGGTVDSARPGGEELTQEKESLPDEAEQALFAAFRTTPTIFQRDAATRRSRARLDLRESTGMMDEAIEGWAVMLNRDPRRLRRLEAKYAAFAGQQRELQGTAWRAAGESATEDSEASGPENARRGYPGRGGGRGRGRGQGQGRGRGGSAAGPANEQGTQHARDRKEQHKGSRANHNRRDQRARKMARGGFPG